MNENLCRELAEKYPEYLPEPFDNVYEMLGFEAINYVLKEYGGTHIYVPQAMSVFRDCLAQRIREEYNGFNRKKLASKYGITDNTVKNIISG